ncbi:DUF1707 domain-containing protein [Streptomyces sp. RFCAC02]|uniref:DUF1707 SHOCT-like domain-containing protein n=1 Tax=Streptomyces sp. RFCAC02 TaxID=2499143 RepID=UPI0010215EE4|nr:DUF1707 domain-containing protein [Streptomyces sp. RFCAC02]
MTAEKPPAVRLGKESPPPVRASDGDRDRVAEILAEALAEGRIDADEHAERVDAVYAARTVDELGPLIRDLPAGQPPAPARASAGGPGAAPPHGGHGARNVVAVLSGAARRGRWSTGGTINAVAVLGGVELDFTQAMFEQQYVTVNAVALLGGIEIRVPENVSLRCEGTGFLGGFEVEEAEAADPDAPVVIVKGWAILGGVDAKPVRGKRVKDLRRD